MNRLQYLILVMGVVCVCLIATAPDTSFATTVPITFENPPYTLGSVNGKDGWVGNSTVVNTNVISGSQSLRYVQNNGTVRTTYLNILEPTNLTFKVRVDAGTSLGSDAAFEIGTLWDTSNLNRTLFTMILNLNNSRFQYYQPVGGNLSFPSNPTWSLGTTYRFELTGMSIITNDFDVTVYNDANSMIVASATNIPFHGPGDNYNPGSALGFYIRDRNVSGIDAYVDDIVASVVPVPEPTQLAVIGSALVLPALLRRRTSKIKQSEFFQQFLL